MSQEIPLNCAFSSMIFLLCYLWDKSRSQSISWKRANCDPREARRCSVLFLYRSVDQCPPYVRWSWSVWSAGPTQQRWSLFCVTLIEGPSVPNRLITSLLRGKTGLRRERCLHTRYCCCDYWVRNGVFSRGGTLSVQLTGGG